MTINQFFRIISSDKSNNLYKLQKQIRQNIIFTLSTLNLFPTMPSLSSNGSDS